ncbi:hypothetical protein [Galbibacter mesophilus]|uniref:hypothetical protein n=1 Tax=Galbibacter mesophilus TaxID=379069 RepID=UPI00191DDB62|nr:hypothetical protein [Galbibacter mesophilus]MCM5661573.1 hypothetical protein [Galbibacter mesophilus]
MKLNLKIKNFLMVLLLSSAGVSAQDNVEADVNMFDPVYNSYSGNKLSIVKLGDGTVIEGYKKDVDRKKGQIYYIKIKDSVSGKKHRIDSEDIDEMYLYPGGLEKLGKISRFLEDTRQWESRKLDGDIISQGYIYFKKHTVSLKNKKKHKDYLMQLVNPTFSDKIEVYGDPNAKRTTSIGIGGFNVAGGLDKSYYVKKGDDIFWLNKKDFKEAYDSLFADSEAFKLKYPKNKIEWKNLGTYIFEYTKMVN